MTEQPILIDVPGWRTLRLRYLLLDFTGTLSKCGELLPEVQELLHELAGKLHMIVASADTFGTAQQALVGLPVEFHPVETGADKAHLIGELGSDSVVAIGNGRNDVAAVETAILGIAVIGPEGAAVELLQAADIVVRDIRDALSLLIEPRQIIATLRQ
jgi:soluble P-type ATPase